MCLLDPLNEFSELIVICLSKHQIAMSLSDNTEHTGV
jgi:hypothetical protein